MGPEPLQAESGGSVAKEPAECVNSSTKEGPCSPPPPGKSMSFSWSHFSLDVHVCPSSSADYNWNKFNLSVGTAAAQAA